MQINFYMGDLDRRDFHGVALSRTQLSEIERASVRGRGLELSRGRRSEVRMLVVPRDQNAFGL